MRAALLASIATLATLAGCLQEFEDPHYVRIVSVDLSPADVLSQDVVLNVTSTLDNRGGGASGDIKLVIKAYSEESGFLVAENESLVGRLGGDTTRSVDAFLRVPRSGNLRIDVALFEDDQGKERASVSTRNLGALEPEVVDTGLRIRDMDFLVQNVTREGNATRARIQVDLYLTNEGDAASEDLRIQVKAREISTRLVSDIAWVDTGSVPRGSTLIRSTNLTVADGYNYVIEVITWRNDVVVARNEDTVQLAPTFTKPTDQELVITDPNVNDFLNKGQFDSAPGYPTHEGRMAAGDAPAPAVPAPGLAALLLAIGVASVLAFARRKRA